MLKCNKNEIKIIILYHLLFLCSELQDFQESNKHLYFFLQIKFYFDVINQIHELELSIFLKLILLKEI